MADEVGGVVGSVDDDDSLATVDGKDVWLVKLPNMPLLVSFATGEPDDMYEAVSLPSIAELEPFVGKAVGDAPGVVISTTIVSTKPDAETVCVCAMPPSLENAEASVVMVVSMPSVPLKLDPKPELDPEPGPELELPELPVLEPEPDELVVILPLLLPLPPPVSCCLLLLSKRCSFSPPLECILSLRLHARTRVPACDQRCLRSRNRSQGTKAT